MISIKIHTFKNIPASLEFNEKVLQIQAFLSNSNEKNSFTQTLTGFLSIIHCISTNIHMNMIAYPLLRPAGIILFNDRIVINPFLFALFIDWDEEVLEKIISAPEFHSTFLKRDQFVSLLRKNYITGSIFDWKLLTYPPNLISEQIIQNIYPNGGESFYIVADQPPALIDEPNPKMCLMSAKVIDDPPSRSIWITYKNLPYEEIFLKFADEKPSSKKCWLLYKDCCE